MKRRRSRVGTSAAPKRSTTLGFLSFKFLERNIEERKMEKEADITQEKVSKVEEKL